MIEPLCTVRHFPMGENKMANKLCVILETNYPYDSNTEQAKRKEREAWQIEVNTDTQTVKDTLTDHDHIVIKITGANSAAEVSEVIHNGLIPIDKQYDSCHIVLNTHGKAGQKDLQDFAVQSVLKKLSSRDIKISQMTALICHAMTEMNAAEMNTSMNETGLNSEGTRKAKDSSMKILRNKLLGTPTHIQQIFKIVGLAQAFDPITDRKLIEEVLNGEGGESITVWTQLESSNESDVSEEDLRACIDFLQKYNDPNPVLRVSKKWDKPSKNTTEKQKHLDIAANMMDWAFRGLKADMQACFNADSNILPEQQQHLSQLLANMKTDIDQYIDECKKDPNFGKPIKDQASYNKIVAPLDAKSAEIIIQLWHNTFKLRSTQKLTLMSKHLDFLSPAPQTPASRSTSPVPSTPSITSISLFSQGSEHEYSPEQPSTSSSPEQKQ